jgi:SAM-dependent methyltransferase
VEAPLAASFDRTAEDYELGRPEWPGEAVDALGLPPDAEVLELGSGTGKLTRRLVERVARVVAVEPLPGMRAVLARAVPAAESIDARAEALPLPDASVDAVVSSDAFHWFDLRRTLAEIRRVLRPTGILAVLTSKPDGPVEPSIHGVSALFAAHRRPAEHPGSRFDSGEWLRAFSAPPAGRVVRWEQTLGREEAVSYHASLSWIAALPETEREGLLGQLRDLLPDVTYRRRWRGQVLIFAHSSIKGDG